MSKLYLLLGLTFLFEVFNHSLFTIIGRAFIEICSEVINNIFVVL